MIFFMYSWKTNFTETSKFLSQEWKWHQHSLSDRN